MRRAVRHLRWCLLAVGLLAAALPALAQPVPPTDEALRLQAAQVELAWLADPQTFRWELAARPSASAVEVCGAVPDPASRQHALDVARAGASCTLVDHLQVRPELAAVKNGLSAEALRDAALALLTEAFPRRAGDFQVVAATDGQVQVSGTVGSLAEKLAVSRRLRWLNGCTSVVNRLDIKTSAAEAGAPYVSSGIVLVSHRTAAPGTTIPVAALQRRIETVCGRTARAVEVVAVGENEVEIRLRVATIADGGRLSSAIVRLPELARYRVNFQVRVDP